MMCQNAHLGSMDEAVFKRNNEKSQKLLKLLQHGGCVSFNPDTPVNNTEESELTGLMETYGPIYPGAMFVAPLYEIMTTTILPPGLPVPQTDTERKLFSRLVKEYPI